MARVKFTRDSAGIAAILRSTDFGQVAAAQRVAAQVRAQNPGVEVVVDTYTTRGGRMSPRQAASVTIRDKNGRLLQVRDGALTRAASAAGLEVKTRP